MQEGVNKMQVNPKLKLCHGRKNLLFVSLTLFMLLTSLFACVHGSNVKGQTEKLVKPNTASAGKNEQSQNSSTKNRHILIGLVFALVITFMLSFFMGHPKE